MHTSARSICRHAPFGIAAAAALLLTVSPQPARAGINVGAGIGVAKRTADPPVNLKAGLAFQLHAELGLLPFLNLGPYFAHYQLGMSDVADATTAFNAIGLRARLILPLGDFHPYGYVGIGYTAASYSSPNAIVGGIAIPERSATGHFFETPIGVGLAYDVASPLQIFAEAAYRPAMGFGGSAFPDTAPRPTSGYTVLIGAAINL